MVGFTFDTEGFGHSKILRVDHEILCCVILSQTELIIQIVHNQLKKYIPDIYELAQSNSCRV